MRREGFLRLLICLIELLCVGEQKMWGNTSAEMLKKRRVEG